MISKILYIIAITIGVLILLISEIIYNNSIIEGIKTAILPIIIYFLPPVLLLVFHLDEGYEMSETILRRLGIWLYLFFVLFYVIVFAFNFGNIRQSCTDFPCFLIL